MQGRLARLRQVLRPPHWRRQQEPAAGAAPAADGGVQREGGASVELELWAVPPAGLATILLREPPGLSIGKVALADGTEVLGVLGEAILCEGQREITGFGGWRAYTARLND